MVINFQSSNISQVLKFEDKIYNRKILQINVKYILGKKSFLKYWCFQPC